MPAKSTKNVKKKAAPKKTAAKPKRVVHRAKPAEPAVEALPPVRREPRAAHDRSTFAVGRRKTAVARVRRTQGASGEYTINGLPLEQYFQQPELQRIVRGPVGLVEPGEAFSYSIKVNGGGSHSQAEAIRHGLARILLKVNPDYRPVLKQAGWLKRDARVKERKKPGLHRARRAPQWQKR